MSPYTRTSNEIYTQMTEKLRYYIQEYENSKDNIEYQQFMFKIIKETYLKKANLELQDINFDIFCNTKTHNDRVDFVIMCLRNKLITGYDKDTGFY